MEFDGITELKSVVFASRLCYIQNTQPNIRQIFWYPGTRAGRRDVVEIIYEDGRVRQIFDYDEMTSL